MKSVPSTSTNVFPSRTPPVTPPPPDHRPCHPEPLPGGLRSPHAWLTGRVTALLIDGSLTTYIVTEVNIYRAHVGPSCHVWGASRRALGMGSLCHVLRPLRGIPIESQLHRWRLVVGEYNVIHGGTAVLDCI